MGAGAFISAIVSAAGFLGASGATFPQLFTLVAVAVWLLGPPPVGRAKESETRVRLPRALVLAVIAFALMHTARMRRAADRPDPVTP